MTSATDPRAALYEQLQAFLAEPNYAKDDGWPNISDSEFQAFNTIVYEIARIKWGEDCDGDQPVKIRVVDRKREDDVVFLPLQHAPYHSNNLEEHLQTELSNIGRATCAIEAYAQRLRISERHLLWVNREQKARAQRAEAIAKHKREQQQGVPPSS